MNTSHRLPFKASTYIVLLLCLALLLGGYALLRYTARIGEGDTSVFSSLVAQILGSGQLVPPQGGYQNGYGYQVLAAWLVAFTGLPLSVIQVAGGALLLGWLVLPAWLAYREFTHSELAATLACLVLLVQPDFLFPLLRGTHEKFTRGLMFLCLYLLLRSLRSPSLRQVAFLIACFYLSAYALISFNSFYAISFILAVILALAFLWLALKRTSPTGALNAPLVPKFLYVTLSLLVLAFIFVFYSYPPAMRQLFILRGVWDKLAMLFLQVEQSATDPYQVFTTGWVSLPVYYLVSLGNWLLLGSSLLLWLSHSWSWLVRRRLIPAWHDLSLWAFYAAFAFLGFVSILVDVSGALSANLQHRSFPSFVMLAAPLVGAWLAGLKFSPRLPRRLAWAALSLAFSLFMLLSVFKATNEPLLSNYWSFYTPAEYRSVAWAQQRLPGASLWVGQWAAISPAFITLNDGQPLGITLDAFHPEASTRDFLLSDEIRLYCLRTHCLLPIQPGSLLTYDNGAAQIYHRRPLTPFQK